MCWLGKKLTHFIVLQGPFGFKSCPSFFGTPLHVASFCGKEEIASLLIEKGADVNANNGHRKVCVFFCFCFVFCFLFFVFVCFLFVFFFLTLLFSLSFKKYGQTPLHYALRNGKEEVASLLIEKGADINVQNSVCVFFCFFFVFCFCLFLFLFSFFSLFYPNLSFKKCWHTPLHLAIENGGKEEITSLLIEKGADIDAKTKVCVFFCFFFVFFLFFFCCFLFLFIFVFVFFFLTLLSKSFFQKAWANTSSSCLTAWKRKSCIPFDRERGSRYQRQK